MFLEGIIYNDRQFLKTARHYIYLDNKGFKKQKYRKSIRGR